MSVPFLVRVQSPDHGTKRIIASPNQSLQTFFKLIQEEFKLKHKSWNIWLDRAQTKELSLSKNTSSLRSYNIKHGDMVYLEVIVDENDVLNNEAEAKSSLTSIEEDAIDQILWKLDGKIERGINKQLCRHGPMGKCLHCVPLEPFDEEYLATLEPAIKFLSFHSYLRKITTGADKGKFATLENTSCKIKPGCKEHLPWPAGVCTKCQPNAVTLQRQKFRHVDFIQFENSNIVNNFLDFWRVSGKQRIGFLYGKYEHHKEIPLGIRAVVTAIYEPPQTSTKNSVELLENERQQSQVDAMAARLDLRMVGWIFTDLLPLDTSSGSVKHFRGNVNTHFLSAEECIMAAQLQNRYPNPCRLASEGVFGSKFVTVVVTGDSTNQIHFDGYQVSDQCMALVRDECLLPTIDAPELGYAKESSNQQYVPDVFYKEIDKYRNEVTRLARPLPVEYLLLDIAVAFPKEQAFTFYSPPHIKPFPIENRESIRQLQDLDAFSKYMAQHSTDHSTAFRNFHLLIFMASCDMLPLKDAMGELLDGLKGGDEGVVQGWMKGEAWSTVEHILNANGSGASTSSGFEATSTPSSDAQAWNCKHCTFINSADIQACEMCSLPKN